MSGRTPPIRVLHVVSGDLWAGAEVQLYNLARAAKHSSTLQFDFVLLNDGLLAQKLRDLGLPVHVLDESKLGSLELLRMLVRYARARRPDVIHTHRRKEHVLGAVAAATMRRVVSVRTVHGAPEHRHSFWNIRQTVLRVLDALALRLLQRTVVCVSASLAKDYERRGARVVVIPNGIDYEDVVRRSAMPYLPVEAGDGIRVGLVGRLVNVKRVDLFVDVAALVEQRWPGRFRFYIVGDGPLRANVEQLIRARGLVGLVELTGFVENVPAVLRGLSALLMTSDSEGLPMVLLEAMALRVPVISRDVGEMRTVLADGSAGVLLPGAAPEAFARELGRLVEDRDAFSEQANRAHERLIGTYSATACAAAYSREYFAALAASHGSSRRGG